MKMLANQFGLIGAGIALLTDFFMIPYVLLSISLEADAPRAIGSTLAMLLITGCGFLGAVQVEKQPETGTALLAISGVAWTAVALWLLDHAWFFWAPSPICFGLAAALGFLACLRDRAANELPA